MSEAAYAKTACFPPVGDYGMIVDMLMEKCLGYKTIPCPATTRRTVEIGSRNSPDMVCTPFKVMTGNLMEALDRGANLLVMPGAACRLGFYDILHKQILTDLGYEFTVLTMFDYVPNSARLFKALKTEKPELTQERFDYVMNLLIRIVLDMDEIADYIRRNMAFEINKGEYEGLYRAYLREVRNTGNAEEAAVIGNKYRTLMDEVLIDKPVNPIRIGIVGELYAVIEPFFNCYTERWFAEHGVEINRPIDLTRLAQAFFTVSDQIARTGGFVTYNVGSTANDSLASAYEMMSDGVDGIIHIKPSSCSPEITAMSVLQNMSRDLEVPVMYLTFDTETSEAGLQTRLEAFYDMIVMRKGRQGVI